MALPPSKQFIQDLPPAGGFQKPANFPSTGFRRRSPGRGPPGYILVGGAALLVGIGLYRALGDIEERNYYNLSRFNERFERAYVLQAQEETRWARRQKEFLDGERAVMKGVPGWVVGKRRFFLQWEDRPDQDVFDPRKIGPF